MIIYVVTLITDFYKMNTPRKWGSPPSHLFKQGSMPSVKIQVSYEFPLAFMVGDSILPTPADHYSRSSHDVKQIVYDPRTNTISFLFGSHPCWSLVIINVNTKNVMYSKELSDMAPSMCLLPGILLLFIRSNFYYVNLASVRKDTPLKEVLDLDQKLYLCSDFNELDAGGKALSGVDESLYLGNNLVCVTTRRKRSSVIKVTLDINGNLTTTVILGLLPPHAKNFTISHCCRFLIWCEINAVMIHYVQMNFTEEAPLFTVDGIVEIDTLKFTEKDGSITVIAVLKDKSTEESVPLF